jgi:hypothetical protein
MQFPPLLMRASAFLLLLLLLLLSTVWLLFHSPYSCPLTLLMSPLMIHAAASL